MICLCCTPYKDISFFYRDELELNPYLICKQLKVVQKPQGWIMDVAAFKNNEMNEKQT